jgi:hypothetical protein
MTFREFMTRDIARRDNVIDRKVRSLFAYRITPSQALVASAVVCVFCVWCFAVVFLGWPRAWARIPFAVCMFIAPALSFVSARELWRSGWSARSFLAFASATAAFGFWCATTYLVIYHVHHAV